MHSSVWERTRSRQKAKEPLVAVVHSRLTASMQVPGCGEPDLVINMYKRAGVFDQMIRLFMKLRKDLLKDTHHHLGQSLEMEGNLK